MSDLSEFLLARIAEDEAAAGSAAAWWDTDQEAGYFEWPSQESSAHVLTHDPARVLAECEAKRQMIPHLDASDTGHGLDRCDRCSVLRLLAVTYADHPDYRDKWRP